MKSEKQIYTNNKMKTKVYRFCLMVVMAIVPLAISATTAYGSNDKDIVRNCTAAPNGEKRCSYALKKEYQAVEHRISNKLLLLRPADDGVFVDSESKWAYANTIRNILLSTLNDAEIAVISRGKANCLNIKIGKDGKALLVEMVLGEDCDSIISQSHIKKVLKRVARVKANGIRDLRVNQYYDYYMSLVATQHSVR